MSEVKRDIALYPGTFVLIQDGSKGTIKVCTGPTVVTPSAQDKPVIYDRKKGTFVQASSLEEAVRISPVAVDGFYIELLNPAKDNAHPSEGQTASGMDLQVGRKINIPGPVNFALWPGQVATVIRGHHMRSNQYLLCRVSNEVEAKKNWGSAIMKAASKLTPPAESASQEEKEKYAKEFEAEKQSLSTVTRPPPDLTIGKLFIIRGTDVSFFIPPTGVTVVEESTDAEGRAIYARDALTLERLEYAVMVDENGKKRYAIGPDVVFPTPTERFIESKEDGKVTRKFRAIELNDIQGIHLKVIADYTDENKKEFKAGQELFVTGKDTPIYYPREEHAAIKYDGKTKHFATAVPAGEARYVMNRMTGVIQMVSGPTMLLPDPRTEIIVRRVLSDKQTMFWYPGNAEALAYNQHLRSIAANAPTTRQGVVSEGELERSMNKGGRMGGVPGAAAIGAAAARSALGQVYSSTNMAEQSHVSKEQGYIGEELTRASGYNAPRTITLEGKYQGVPTIELWTNYGALVISKSGGRRVEVGPKTLQLQYDESLELMELSTGKPKTTDNLLKTVYLRVENNKVSDRLYVETSDHVSVDLSLSYLVNFEGNKDKWFAVENYVKFLCDHLRSILKGAIRKITIAEFYQNSTDIIRKILLQKEGKNEGLLFEENNMRLKDIEVLGVEIKDERIRQLISTTQHEAVRANLDIANAKRNLEVTRIREEISREMTALSNETVKLQNESEEEVLASKLTLVLAKIGNQLKEANETKELEIARQAAEDLKINARLAIQKKVSDFELSEVAAKQAQKIELLKAEADAIVTKFKAVEGNFTQALLSLSNNDTLIKVAEAWNIQKVIGGENIADAMSKVFAGSPVEALVKRVTAGVLPVGTNGSSQKSTNA